MRLRKPKIHEIEMDKDTTLMVQVDDQGIRFIAGGPLTQAACEKVWKSAVNRGVIV